MKGRKRQRRQEEKPARIPPPTTDTPERDGPDPIRPTTVRLNALREVLRILNEERPTRFLLPESSERFYMNTPEATFCIMVQHGYDVDAMQIGTDYSRATIIGALVALACGADLSHATEGRVA